MYTKLIIVGNLTADPTMRYTPSGVPVTSFSVAVNKRWKDSASGETKEKVAYYRLSAWRKLAETVSTYLTKGQRVLVEAEDIEARTYQNKSGEWVASLEATANNVTFLSAKGEGVGESHGPSSAAQAVQNAPGADSDVRFMEDSLIPF
jgi:single-strand DNA-binding protein